MTNPSGLVYPLINGTGKIPNLDASQGIAGVMRYNDVVTNGDFTIMLIFTLTFIVAILIFVKTKSAEDMLYWTGVYMSLMSATIFTMNIWIGASWGILVLTFSVGILLSVTSKIASSVFRKRY
jgi:hypothetical protein